MVARYNGRAPDDNAVALVVDAAANIYVTGNSFNAANNTDYATVKYDSNGNQLWSFTMGRAAKNDYATSASLWTARQCLCHRHVLVRAALPDGATFEI